MIHEYTKDMFEKDKKDMLMWLEENWTWRDSNYIHLGNILNQLKLWVNDINREGKRNDL